MNSINKTTALKILETILETTDSITKRNALEAVIVWARNQPSDIPEDYEQRKAFKQKLENQLRNNMTVEERRETAAFYLQGLESEG